MPIEDPTFGCGTFLPGVGPGNFPDFDGGGTIDSGEGTGNPWTSAGDQEDVGPPTDGGPPDDGDFPSWPGDIIIISDDPKGSFPDNTYDPTGWLDNFTIINIGLVDAGGNGLTYGGIQYIPTWDDDGKITFPGIGVDFDIFQEPLALTVTTQWESLIPGDPTEYIEDFTTTSISVFDAGGSDGGDGGATSLGGDFVEVEPDVFQQENRGPGSLGVVPSVTYGGTITLGDDDTGEKEEVGYPTNSIEILYNAPTGSYKLEPTYWEEGWTINDTQTTPAPF